MMSQDAPIIDIKNLSVGFSRGNGAVQEVLRDVDLTLDPGEVVGLVGESGSGKSTLALAAMGYLRPGLRHLNGSVHFSGQSLFSMQRSQLESLRGGKLALVPQNAGQALTPTMRIGRQLCEALELHCGLQGAECVTRAEALLGQVRLRDIKALMRRYPHEMSGGQQQRVAIAMALAGEPQALVLDEPTTGLDVTTQIHILDLLRDLAKSQGIAMLLVSHDLGVIGHCCQRVAVMYAGCKRLDADVTKVLTDPGDDYTEALLQATPRIKPVTTPPVTVQMDAPALQLEDLALCYKKSGVLSVFGPRPEMTVEDVCFRLGQGETIGLVGESGSGKSTVLKAIAGLMPRAKGEILLRDDTPLPELIKRRSADQLRRIQMIFQNADQALNPRQSVAESLAQPLRLYFSMTGDALRKRAAELLDQVRLPAAYLDKFPGQLSGGEKQRLAIARAFAAEPEIVLCDEITSALDVSVQATVLDLLQELKRERGTSYVFVSHDLAVVQALADQVVVLQHGRIREIGPVAKVYGDPQHEYTRKLFDAVLEPQIALAS